jgi:hypothetical protein
VERTSTTIATVALGVLLAACGGTTDPAGPSSTRGAAGETSDAQLAAWEHLDVVEAVLPDRAAATVLQTDVDITDAWDRYGFAGEAPFIDVEHDVLLLLGRPDNACPDDLVSLRVDAERLATGWLEPPGGCNDPLLLWLHAVRVHRGVLGTGFSYAPEAPFTDELTEVSIELPPYDGDAPPDPALPEAMSEAELAAVFDGHAVARCGPEHRPIEAAFGAPDREISEFDPDQTEAIETLDRALPFLAGEGYAPDRDVTGLIDRSEGPAHAAVVVHEADVDAVQALLDAEFGAGGVRVWADPWNPAQIHAAQETLLDLMGPATDGPGAIVGLSGPPGPVTIGMVDPTREALDRIAAVVDPTLVCVDVELSGVAPADEDDAAG